MVLGEKHGTNYLPCTKHIVVILLLSIVEKSRITSIAD